MVTPIISLMLGRSLFGPGSSGPELALLESEAAQGLPDNSALFTVQRIGDRKIVTISTKSDARSVDEVRLGDVICMESYQTGRAGVVVPGAARSRFRRSASNIPKLDRVLRTVFSDS